ncbi:hypothetical protein T02_8785 [Trichinella nativa]|uniref:Uncharacterized protein n=1 Tax=Trichinella nativa TaxID=6335 RepID=A0A0V1LPA7_9BILA|nr:hypothetical protein T02_8785 [Trichinella nativa]
MPPRKDNPHRCAKMFDDNTQTLNDRCPSCLIVSQMCLKAIAHGANGKRLVINCLLYSGAEQTLFTEDTARALGLVGVAETVTVKVIGGIHCAPTLARRVGFRLSPLKVNEHDLDVEPIEA